ANEIIVARTHRNAYDRALRSAGAVLVDAGTADRETNAGIRGLEAWEVESVLSTKTAAIAENFSGATRGDMPVLAEVARKHGLPLIVDAAAQLPPAENLKAPLAMGATLVVYSGGKAIGGPQSSGILAGRRDLIASAALQMLDMDVRHEAFYPPPVFFGNQRPPAIPRHGIGRGFKASKEAIVGLLTALEEFLTRDERAVAGAARDRLEAMAGMLRGECRLKAEIVAGRSAAALPRLALHVEAPPAGPGAAQLAARLRRGSPRVFLAEGRIGENVLVLDLIAVMPEEDAAVVQTIKSALE
ncbi:MAG: L-seryl-tRNA selenium transferase, partial [Hyphomicrobiaceae bacterium]